MANYEKLEEVIREACPELMKLSFGCRVKLYDQEQEHWLRGISKVVRICPKDEIITDFLINVNWKKEEYKIIGHPIQLDHVIKAIRKKQGILGDGQLIADIVGIEHGIETNRIVAGLFLWEIGDLNNQSGKIKRLLIDLLVTKDKWEGKE